MPRKYSEAQNKATQKYIKNNYDTITVRVPKGMREKYNAHAESKNTSLSKLIIALLNKDIEAHNKIKAMITEYESKNCNYDCEEYRKQGAIEVLERLLEEAQ